MREGLGGPEISGGDRSVVIASKRKVSLELSSM